MIGQGGYLVQDAADKQGTAIAPALSGINPVDGIGTALDVAFERLPCLFLFLFLRSCGFLFRLTVSRTFSANCGILRNGSDSFCSFFLPVVIKSAPSRHHRVGTAGEDRELGGQLLPVGGDVCIPFLFRHELQVVVQLLSVNHDVRLAANLRIEGTPGVCVASLFPHIIQIGRMFECYGFPVFEVLGMQFIVIFRISVQVYIVARSMMLLSEMERYGGIVRTFFRIIVTLCAFSMVRSATCSSQTFAVVSFIIITF